MKERRQRLSSICASHVKGKPGPDKFEAWDQRLSQDLKRDSFLVDHKRKLLYCWNHKVIIMLSVSGVPLINHLSNFWVGEGLMLAHRYAIVAIVGQVTSLMYYTTPDPNAQPPLPKI